MDQCCKIWLKNLRLKFWTNARSRTVKDRPSRHKRPAGVEAGAQKQEIQNTARQAGGGGGRRRDEAAKRIKIMKDLTKKIR